MKIRDIKTGQVVYIKQSESFIYGNPEIPRTVISISTEKRNNKRILLEGFKRSVSSGILTDTRCSIMTCKNCKYHPRKDL